MFNATSEQFYVCLMCGSDAGLFALVIDYNSNNIFVVTLGLKKLLSDFDRFRLCHIV